jgi:hypothetical protein
MLCGAYLVPILNQRATNEWYMASFVVTIRTQKDMCCNGRFAQTIRHHC